VRSYCRGEKALVRSQYDSRQGALPNLIIIGAQKCATTSLHYYLNFHPQVAMSREKELDFFALEANWDKGIEWYKAQFQAAAPIRGEASPRYTFYPLYQGVPQRMHELIPMAKLVYILRDPIDRIVSSYVHRYASGLEDRPIGEALADPESNRYVWRSMYFTQLKQYLLYYPRSRILILTLEELERDRRGVLQGIFRFLEIDDRFNAIWFSYKKHPSRRKRRLTARGRRLARTPMMEAVERLPFDLREKVKALVYFPFSRPVQRPELDESLRQSLIRHLADDVDELRSYTGMDLTCWSV